MMKVNAGLAQKEIGKLICTTPTQCACFSSSEVMAPARTLFNIERL